MSVKRIVLFLFLFLLSFNAFAQKTDDAVKEKLQRETKLLEQILTDAKNLRLPENRALVFARVGSAYWKIDEKFARKLFQDSISDLLTAQTEIINERGSNKQYFQALVYGQSPRLDIINQIGNRDAELALEYLTKTRPPVIAQALANLTNNSYSNSYSAAQQYARNEINTEQRLIGLAADQNPEIAIKRVRESLKKGISYETLNLLKKIYAKDAETANKLAEEVFQTFIETDFSKDYQYLENIGYFINDLGSVKAPDEKTLKVSDATLRSLVTKMIDNWLDPKTIQLYGYWNSAPVVERLFPDRFAKVKQKLEKYNSRVNPNDESQKYSKLMESNLSPEEMVAQAENFQSSYKNEIYRAAADKFAQNGNVAQAEKILQTNVSEEQADYYLAQFYANLSYQLANQGKFAEAAGYIDQIPDEAQRINPFINLANIIFQKDPKENKTFAQNVLNQARALIPDAPETQNDLNAAGYLANAFLPIEPNESFRLLEAMTPSLNELIQATVVMMKFRNYGGYRQGEMQLTAGSLMGVSNIDNVLRMLKDKDFDRTLQFTNGFNRFETRILLQLQLIDENLLNSGFVISDLPITGRRFTNFR